MINKTLEIELSETNEGAISLIRGDTFELIVNVKSNGVAFDMTGYTPVLSAMIVPTETTADIQLYGADVDTSKAGEGTLTFTFSPSDTENETAGDYYYDIQITKDSTIYTIIKSTLELIQDVTKGTDLITKYKDYAVLVTQTGTTAPVDTVLENNLGETVVWTYSSLGTYIGTATGIFTAKTFIPAHLKNFVDKYGVAYRLEKLDANRIQLTTLDNGQLANGKLTDFPIELKIYY